MKRRSRPTKGPAGSVNLSRRGLLRGLAASALVGPPWLAACESDEGESGQPPAAPKTMAEPQSSPGAAAECAQPAGKAAAISHGPLTGGNTDSRLVISARLDGPASVRFRLVPEGGEAFYSECVLAEAAQDFAVRLVMADLPAGTRYEIVPEVDGAQDKTHAISSHTFPAISTAAPLSFAFGSCQRHNSAATEIISAGKTFDVIAALPEQPLFFAQTGDWTYPDYDFAPSSGGGFAGVDADGNNYTVFPEALAKSYHKRLDPEYPMRKVLAKVPLAHVWDDHDFAQNNSWSGVSGKQSDRVDAFER